MEEEAKAYEAELMALLKRNREKRMQQIHAQPSHADAKRPRTSSAGRLRVESLHCVKLVAC